jgi:hypothetical protein
MRLIKSQYRLIAKEDLIELLADLTSKYSNLDLKTGNPAEITRLKSEINAIQKEIFKRRSASSTKTGNERSTTDTTDATDAP